MEHKKAVLLCSTGFPLIVAAMNDLIYEGGYNYYYAGAPAQSSTLGTLGKAAGLGALGLGTAALIDPEGTSNRLNQFGSWISDSSKKIPGMVSSFKGVQTGEAPAAGGGAATQGTTQAAAAPAAQQATPAQQPAAQQAAPKAAPAAPAAQQAAPAQQTAPVQRSTPTQAAPAAQQAAQQPAAQLTPAQQAAQAAAQRVREAPLPPPLPAQSELNYKGSGPNPRSWNQQLERNPLKAYDTAGVPGLSSTSPEVRQSSIYREYYRQTDGGRNPQNWNWNNGPWNKTPQNAQSAPPQQPAVAAQPTQQAPAQQAATPALKPSHTPGQAVATSANQQGAAPQQATAAPNKAAAETQQNPQQQQQQQQPRARARVPRKPAVETRITPAMRDAEQKQWQSIGGDADSVAINRTTGQQFRTGGRGWS